MSSTYKINAPSRVGGMAHYCLNACYFAASEGLVSNDPLA
jgi:hypothetical protein